ncbi:MULTISPECIES: uracil-DNA glycosylase [Aminobacterium]|jgi:DNA polymerase|uniref:uracil-DNA glycosylase n=1 Tax=Aminobacterium TaxID=81466 RepID=UPI0004665B91|nr:MULTISPECIES: uracil-DNA glycosylase [Aminobacterium]
MADIFTLEQRVDKCRLCSLWEERHRIVVGEGSPCSKAMLVGEAPGAREDEMGRPFVGRSGKFLSELMKEAGVSRDSFYITNMVKCRPPENRKPKECEIEACRAFLEEQILFFAPDLILTVGNTPTQWFLNTKKGMTALRGQFYPWKFQGRSLLIRPLFHPSYLLRNRSREEGHPLAQTLLDLQEVKKFFEK